MIINEVRLTNQWDFVYQLDLTFSDGIPIVPAKKTFQAKISVPGIWDDFRQNIETLGCEIRVNPDYMPAEYPVCSANIPDASLPYIKGVGWYRKKVEIAEIKNKLAVLHIGGVRLEAWLWVNGHYIGYHLGHSTPFEFSIEKYLKPNSANEIIIAVSNLRNDRSGSAIRGYKGHMGGIYRPICVRFSGEVRVEDIFIQVHQNNLQLHWDVELAGDVTKGGLSLAWAVHDRKTKQIIKEGCLPVSGQRVSWVSSGEHLHYWSDVKPNLYEAEIRIMKSSKLLDVRKQVFGLRSIRRKNTTLYLNDNPVFLRGLTEHCYFPETCTPHTDVVKYRENIGRFKKLGFNWIRFHTWTPPEEYMQAADEMGMMIQVEAPVGYQAEEWIDILKTCRKHPSVVIYCCGNEELLDERKIETLFESAQLCKKLTPDALFNPQEALRGIEYVWNENDIGDDVVKEPFEHNDKRLNRLKEFSDVFGQYSWGYLSYRANQGDWRELTRRMVIYERPCLSHEVGILGTFLDICLEQQYKNTLIGTDLYEKVRNHLEREGVIDQAKVYYQNSCLWAKSLRKNTLENLRLCKYFAGYDYLGAIDYHWHRKGYTCGIMNEFYELKYGETPDEIKKYNGESALLIDHQNCRNLYFGKEFKINAYLSFFGQNQLTNETLNWSLRDIKGTLYADGAIDCCELTNGCVQQLGAISFKVPHLTMPGKLTLQLKLNGAYELENDWHFWCFPEPLSSKMIFSADSKIQAKYSNTSVTFKALSSNEKTWIVSDIDQTVVSHLCDGGNVVLLGTGPFPALPITSQIASAGRSIGNSATVVKKHPVLDVFPHDGFCDWQFFPMFEKGQAIVFNDLAIDFNPIIEVVSTYKRILKQAALFECKVGKGNLLVCSLNLKQDNPAACYLFFSLLNYSACDQIVPQTEVDPCQLKTLLSCKKDMKTDHSIDMGFDLNAQLHTSSP
ncbi:MAG: sugar-binding domain-containing protein [Phycisphaerae bacterium]|jgi:hypothetical protein